jgi:hypothetical protein
MRPRPSLLSTLHPLLTPLYPLLRTPYRAITRLYQDPITPQKKWLRYLLTKGAQTIYGKKYGITPSWSYAQFQQNLPVVSYEMLYPFIEETMRGKPDVVWPGRIRWFAKSSGTTNDRSKFIPIAPETLSYNHFRAARQLFATYLTRFRDDTRLLAGKILAIGGSHTISHLGPHARYGDLSAVLIENTPWFYTCFRAPEKAIALLPDWNTKVHRMAEAILGTNLTGIAGVPTWTVVLFDEILRRTGASHILEVFPDMEVFFHGAVSFTPYEKLFQRYLPSPRMRYMEIYNASEGFFAFQDQAHTKDLLLLTDHGIFYEFIPFSAWERGDWTAIPLEAVQVGEIYALVITAPGGLWRYLIGDTIRFTSTQPYRLRIVGRTRHFINAFGEEVMVENTDAAIQRACSETGTLIRDYTVAPLYLEAGQRGAHQWLIEFITPPADLQAFAQALDKALQAINSDYEAKRTGDLALGPPLIVPIPPGTFERWLSQRGRLGGQNKVPRLSNTREYVEAILALLRDRGELTGV